VPHQPEPDEPVPGGPAPDLRRPPPSRRAGGGATDGTLDQDALDDAVDRSAAPTWVRAALDRLAEARLGLADELRADAALADALVAVLGASRSLTRLLEQDPDALDVLRALDRQTTPSGSPADMVRGKQHELLRIAARDLTGRDRLEETGRALATLAAAVLDGATTVAGAERLAVIGMGKLGGAELNYSSDIDILFVGEGPRDELEAAAREVMAVARTCFRVDANLRPEGRDGPLVRSIEAYAAYWARWAEPWEFQALLKAVPVAGDRELGDRWLDAARQALWSRRMSADDLRSLRAMKARAEAEVTRRGLAHRELKRAPGGIRDIEFTVQLLQLVHGHGDDDLRAPTTLTALAELASAGYIDPDDAEALADAYRLLRAVEHRLQLLDEQQVHTLPTDAEALDRLARATGYRDAPDGSAPDQLDRDLRARQLAVRSIHERVYFRPLLEAFAEVEGAISPEAAVERLTAFGFTDARRTQAAVRELTRGLNRTSRLMQQMLPLLLDWLSAAPDPDLGLLVLRNLLAGEAQRGRQLVETFRDSPEAARRLCAIAGTSWMLGEAAMRNPDLVARLSSADRLGIRPRAELIASAGVAVGWRDDLADRQDGLRRWKERHLFGIAARDVLGLADVDVVGANLTLLAEATLDAALSALEPTVPFAVIAMGRFGGGELSYGSDLDVIYVYDGRGVAATEEANRLATRLNRFIGGGTPSERIYEIDVDLRPEGRQGPLARSIDAYRTYWATYAETWERQAMTRARVVAGDHALGDRLLDELEPEVWGDGLRTDEVVAIRRMKARVENERIPVGEDPAFHLKLGRGSLSDVEFTAQMLQLQFGVRATGTVAALAALAATDVLADDDAAVLTEAYRFCEQVRNRWHLVNSGPGDSLPTQPEPLLWLARSLDTTPSGLRERYRRVTRRARRVVERVFYGRADRI
jgi:[glutamine synthetase] adenylyltransferase / [glutamine synthetase]-adenylyl-L-tyrosine phosphorylase